MDAIVIKKGEYFNFTYAATRFAPLGNQTFYPIYICDEWRSGFETAKSAGHNLVLFCDSGTVFHDIIEFIQRIDNYPHQGIIGHIIDPLDLNKFFSLHPQAFMLDVQKFSVDCFDGGKFETYSIIRSKENIHDDYTPLWIRPGVDQVSSTETEFGQKLIADQFNRKGIVSNWHRALRGNKIYLYRQSVVDSWIESQQSYLNLAENQLWIVNNQHLPIVNTKRLICPASGLFWIMSACLSQVEQITIVDISRPQIKLVKELINTWNGIDYSGFLFEFIQNNHLTHLQFDQELTTLERLQVQKKNVFCQLVNKIFNQHLKQFGVTAKEFQQRWQQIKTMPIEIKQDNIIDYLSTVQLDPTYTVWISNILNYKYTWLRSTAESITAVENQLKFSGAQVFK